jgi:hypothetical protein
MSIASSPTRALNRLNVYLSDKESRRKKPSTEATAEAAETVLRQSGTVCRVHPPVFRPIDRFLGRDRRNRLALGIQGRRPRRDHRRRKNHSEDECESIWFRCHVRLLAQEPTSLSGL